MRRGSFSLESSIGSWLGAFFLGGGGFDVMLSIADICSLLVFFNVVYMFMFGDFSRKWFHG